MNRRIKGFWILGTTYIAAYAAGFLAFRGLGDHANVYYALLIADAIATVVVWLSVVIFRSASVYDPYWSVQTSVIMLSLMVSSGTFSAGACLLLLFVMIWAVRLTGNFLAGFHDISYVDWRYKMLSEKTGRAFQLVNLAGICMFPTVVVFIASIPAFAFVLEQRDFSVWNLIGFAVMLLGTMLEYFADIQMKHFIKTRKDRSEIIRIGLWKYSRHPNYLGEILFWYGVALVYILPDPGRYFYLAGAVINHLMFLFISVPLAEKNMQKYKSGFEVYRKSVRMFLPIPHRVMR